MDLQTDGIEGIVANALVKNQTLSITGALIFTGKHFVQILEGRPADLNALMMEIERDLRHEDVTILLRKTIATRRFPAWSLAYSGPSRFVSGRVARLIGNTSTETARSASWLMELMEEFALHHAAPPSGASKEVA